MKGPNTTHRSYDAIIARWERCRDCYEGGDRVKSKGEAYLPALDSHIRQVASRTSAVVPNKYQGYSVRALWFNATARTIDGLSGVVFQKAPVINLPDEELEAHVNDVTMAGESLEMFGLRACREILTTGRCGVLIDMPDVDENAPTPTPSGTGDTTVKPDSPDYRPYWASYRAEDILNWRTERIDGDQILTRVVLLEEDEQPDPENEFGVVALDQIRILELVNGVYAQTVYRRKNRTDEWLLVGTTTPTRRGKSLTFIPFVFVGPTSISPDIPKPPLLDLVDANLDHFRLMADLRHLLHFVALPTPWVSGMQPNTTQGVPVTMAIGSGTAWILTDPNAKAGMLEISGEGAQAIERAEETVRKLMSTLGARLLEDTPSVQETAAAVGMRHAGEHATMRTIAGSIEQALTLALKWHVWWIGTVEAPEDVEDANVELNKEFFSTRMTPEELKALLLAFQGDAMSFETFYAALVRGDLARPGIDVEEEKADLDAAIEERMARMPDLMGGVVDPATGDPNDPNAPAPPIAPKAPKAKPGAAASKGGGAAKSAFGKKKPNVVVAGKKKKTPPKEA